MAPDRDGRFKGRIIENAVGETGQNNLATAIFKYQLTDELVGGEWVDVEQEGLEIIGYHYLEKKPDSGGGINVATVDALKRATGWDGRDPMWLQDSDLSGIKVQLKIGMEEYQGNVKAKVQFIDAENATFGIRKADDATRNAIGNRLGSKLRALSGAPAPAPAPTGSPSMPARTTAPPAGRPPAGRPGPAAAPKPTWNADSAWVEFCKRLTNNGQRAVDTQKISDEWFKRLDGKDPATIKPDEWQKFLEGVDASAIRADDIPF